jgi:SAM-dependent methyltransferase
MSGGPGAVPVERCRFCGGALAIPFCDLGSTPLANSYVDPALAGEPDPRFPLNARVCGDCFLVQLDHVADARAIFSDYAYFSSCSTGWLAHARAYADGVSRRLGLGPESLVVEVASNDGYLLKRFVELGVPCLGIEPAANVAQSAIAAGVPTLVRFFGKALADELVESRGHADLVVANNVLAHVPDLNDFVAGLARLAGPKGVVSIEAPHLVRLVEGVQFDTIYHEHYAYWSLHAMELVLAAQGLVCFDLERLETHGGSLRVYAAAAAAAGGGRQSVSPGLAEVRAEESALGVAGAAFYLGFEPRVRRVLGQFRDFLDRARAQGLRVAGYGAAAKGNTFLNALGAGPADLLCVGDKSPAKQGRLLPGSRIPVVSPEAVLAARPDLLTILPWNIAAEVAGELGAIRTWGGRFVTAIPELRVFG